MARHSPSAVRKKEHSAPSAFHVPGVLHLFLCSAEADTAGGLEAAYRAAGYNHFTIRELLHPIEQTALLCGMTYLPPFALFDARTAVEEGRVDQHIDDWIRILEALRDDRIDIAAAQRRPQLNSNLDSVIKET